MYGRQIFELRQLWRHRVVVCVAFFAMVSASRASAQERYWIELRDKGPASTPTEARYQAALSRLSAAARARRLREHTPLVSRDDIDLYQPYIDSLRAMGVQPYTCVRWMNAISAPLTADQRLRIRRLSFVHAIRPVQSAHVLMHNVSSSVLCGYDPVIGHQGIASSQLDRINASPLMAMGFDATGVKLGFCDDGFRWRTMSGLKHANVAREYDYVFHDSITSNQAGDVADQDAHGSSTLSTAVGYEPDTQVGCARSAELFLAKTEDLRSETPLEEDNYAQALQDMEAWGVDVTSTSLGYFAFDSGSTSHAYSDLDGNTTIAARAARHAGHLGVIVVNAMGNSGNTDNPFLDTPADADSTLSVGALDPSEHRADFSSVGPTADGRTKPDVCAPGVDVFAQGPDGGYGYFGGTSFATPLVSSACCLIRQAHPDATAEAIRNAVRATASNHATPNDSVGWGEMNAYVAALELGDVMRQIDASYGSWLNLCVAMASKHGIRNASVEYSSRTGGWLTRPLFLAEDSLIYSTQIDAEPHSVVKYRYVLENGRGETSYLPDSGYYQFTIGEPAGFDISVFPNPVRSRWSSTLSSNEPGDWTLYDAAGREVLSGHVVAPGSQAIPVRSLASGAYLLVMKSTSGEVTSRNLFVLH